MTASELHSRFHVILRLHLLIIISVFLIISALVGRPLLRVLISVARPVLLSLVATTTSTTSSSTAVSLLLALFFFGLPLGLFFFIYFSRLVGILFEGLLVEQEVNLHFLVGSRQVTLPLDCDHLVEGDSLLLVVNLKQDSHFVPALARMIRDLGNIDSFCAKTR